MTARGLARAVDAAALSSLGRPQGVPVRLAIAISAATRGGLAWHVTSATLLATRRSTPQRVAVAGSMAWAATSLVAGCLKRVARRRRPRLGAVGPPVRTSSMPSSHTATAFAFATAAVFQHPAAASLLLPAAAVGWSRLRTRRHFPTDVVAGVVLGVILGGLIGVGVRAAHRGETLIAEEGSRG
ncbi:MAG: phosphatase PAP2 family protein [Ilumatobacteraceae bacterium]